jgi:hypothetical protein
VFYARTVRDDWGDAGAWYVMRARAWRTWMSCKAALAPAGDQRDRVQAYEDAGVGFYYFGTPQGASTQPAFDYILRDLTDACNR